MVSFRAVFFHSVAAAVMAYGYMNLRELPFDAFIRTQKGGHSQYLTIIGLCMAFLCMISGLGHDLLPFFGIFRFAKRVFLMISLPVAVVVTSVYWSLYIFAPEMILKPLPDGMAPQPDATVPSSAAPTALQRIPLTNDLALHAVPALSLLIEFFLIERKYSRAQAVYGGFLICTISAALYGSWVEYLAQFNGAFPYPFLTDNPFNIRVTIYAIASSFALVTFWIMNAVHP